MIDPLTDQIAREAARLLHIEKTATIGEAIRIATSNQRGSDVIQPGHGLVREHLRGMNMQAMGDVGYRGRIQHVWEIAEHVMTILEASLFDANCLFVGRAAKGQIDGPTTIHIRVYTVESDGQLADILVHAGCAEPSFETVNTKFGRLNRIVFDEDEWQVFVTRCPSHLGKNNNCDLFTGKLIFTLSLSELRKQLEPTVSLTFPQIMYHSQ